MPFPPNATFIDYAYRARPAVLRCNAVSTGREIGDMAVEAGTATLTPTAPLFNWSDIEFLGSLTQSVNAVNITGVGTWDAETGVITLRSPLSDSIIGDMVVGATSATLNTNVSTGGDAQFENGDAASILFNPNDSTFRAWWEATTGTQPITAVNVLVQIGDVTLEVNGASLSAIANTIQPSNVEFLTNAPLSVNATTLDWAVYWNSLTSTMTVRALNVDAVIGDRFQDAVSATLSLVAPLALGTDSPVGEAGSITLTAPQIGFQLDWNTVSATQTMVAQAISAIVGDREESTTALTISVNAVNVTPGELEFAIAGTLSFNAPLVDYYAYSDITAAIMVMNAVNLGDPVAAGISAYESSIQSLDPSESGVDLSEWDAWV